MLIVVIIITITSNSRPWRSIGSFMYIGSAGPGPGGRTDGRTVTDGGRTGGRTEGGRADRRRADGRADGRAASTILNDSTTIFIDFHKKHPKLQCFSVVSRPAEAQVSIFTAKMKKASKKTQKKHSVFLLFKSRESASSDFYT